MSAPPCRSAAYAAWFDGWSAVLDALAGDFTREEWAGRIGIKPGTLTHWAGNYGWTFRTLPPAERSARIKAGLKRSPPIRHRKNAPWHIPLKHPDRRSPATCADAPRSSGAPAS